MKVSDRIIALFTCFVISFSMLTGPKMYPIKWTRGIKKDLESGHEKDGGRPPKVDRDTDSKAKRWTAMVYWKKREGHRWSPNTSAAALAYMRWRC